MVAAATRSHSSLDFREPALGKCRPIYFFAYTEVNEHSVLLFAGETRFLSRSLFNLFSFLYIYKFYPLATQCFGSAPPYLISRE